MDPLRNKLVRLAHARPDLRPHLLPLLTKESAGPSYKDYVDRKRKKGEKPLDEKAWESRVKGKGGGNGGAEDGGSKSVSLPAAEGKKLGDVLGGWHESADDPIYAVSSHASAGKPIPADAAKKALGKMTTMLNHADAYRLSDGDKKQLSSAKAMLEKAVGGKSASAQDGAPWVPAARRAGVLRYTGDTVLDKVYALSDLLNEVRYAMPDTPGFDSKADAVQKTLYDLENFVKRV